MTIEELSNWIIANYGWISFIMIALISGLVELVKLPIKKLTSKIKNEKIRKLVNKSIILVTFAIAFGLRYVGSIVLPQFIEYKPVLSLVEGAFSNLVYAMGEGIIPTSKVKTIASTIKDVTDDGEVSLSDVSKVVDSAKETVSENEDSVSSTIKNDKTLLSAKAKFKNLIGKK